MFRDTLIKTLTLMAVLSLIAVPAFAQDATEPTSTQTTAATATLSADGELSGNVLQSSADEITQVPNARVSLVSQGKVVDSVLADASGSFSFANINPGPYQIVGAADGLAGAKALMVEPFVANQHSIPSDVVLHRSTPRVMYQTYSHAPVSTFTPQPVTYSYGGGGGGGRLFGGFGGGGLGGRLGGGLLRSPRGLLVIGGIAGGLAAINDSSPDQ